MKNLFAVASFAVLLPAIGFASDSEAYVYNKDMYGEFNVTTESDNAGNNNIINKIKNDNINDKVNRSMDDGHYYLGGRAELSFLNWKNEYKDSMVPGNSGSDRFSFKPMLGLNVFAGYRFNPDFRADLELGYIGSYSESETEYFYDSVNNFWLPETTKFKLKTYYMTANAYYNLIDGWYVGAGAGVALPKVSIEHTWFGNKDKTSVTPMIALMLGWVYQIDEDTDLDLRYRFSMFDGGDIKVNTLKTDLGWIMDNSVSAGVRVYF